MKRCVKYISLFMVMVMSMLLIACQKGDSGDGDSAKGEDKGKPVVKFLSQNTRSDESRAAIVDEIDQYAKEVSDRYTLDHEGVTGDDIKAKMKVYVASGDIPDVLFYWGAAAYLSSFLDADLLLPVDEFFEYSDLSKEDFQEAKMKEMPDGKVYGIPFENYYGAWLANKDLFDKYNLEYPKTYDDLKTLAQTFSKEGIATVATGSKGGNPAHWHIDSLYGVMEGAEEEMSSISKTGEIATDKFRAALDYWTELQEAGVFPNDTISNGDWAPNFALYNEGKAALIPVYGWQVSAMSDECYDFTEIIDTPIYTGKYAISEEEQKEYGNIAGHGCIFISKDKFYESEEKRDAIVDFVEFYFGEKMNQLRFDAQGMLTCQNLDLNYDGGLPIARDLIANQEEHNFQKTYQMHMYTIPNSNVWADFQTYLDEFVSGSSTTDEYLKKVQDSMDRNYNDK